MSDRVTHSYSDCDGRNGKSIHSVQSVWMAHWTRTSYNSTAETQNHSPTALGNKESDRDSKSLQSIVKLETMSKLSKSVKRLRESETQTFEVINETSSRTIAKETLGNWSLPLHNPCENVKTPFQNPLDCGRAFPYDIGHGIVASRPSLDNPSHSASHPVPYQDPGQYITSEGEKTQKPLLSRSILAAKEEVPRVGMLEHEHGRSVTPYLRQKDPFLVDAPSTSRKLLPEFGGEKLQKIPGCSFIRLLKNEPSPSHVTESKELHPRSFDQQKLPHPLLDVETMRTSNTMDSVVGMAGYHPRVSQTTHSMLITKGADADLLEGNNVIGNSRTWSKINGKASLGNRDSPSKSFGHYKGGMKLQIQNCCHERKENIEDCRPSEFVLKNESSAETETMDMDVFQEKNQLCGTSSSIVKKVKKMDQTLARPFALDGSRKEAGRHKPFKLDINLELPAPTDNMEASSSKTESFDLGSILARAEQPSSSRTDFCPEGLLGHDPANRWVKRLKVSTSSSLAFGTKSSGLAGETSNEKSHKFLSEIPKATITSSGPASNKRHGKELMVHDNTPDLAMNSSPSSVNVIKKDLEVLTSHSWIQRLLRDRTTSATKRPQPAVVCEPQTSKLELDDFQKKQLPSLGAMALMGKAMNGFQPCEFHRKGPLVVWNTRSS